MTRIVCQQLAPTLGDLDANRALALAAIREAIDAGAEVIVLPELITSGYMFTSPQEAAAASIPADHELLHEWVAEAARGGAVIVGGFSELGDDGLVYNSSAIVDGTGIRAIYRKLHLWDGEKAVWEPGSELPPVVDTAVGKIATVICYDLEFPELTRSLALRGAQLIAVPTNWPALPTPGGERPAEVVIAMAAARVNRMAIAVADRAGVERGQDWTSGASIIGADGWVKAESDHAVGPIVADVDLTFALDKQLTPNAHALLDRRPELYGALLEQAALASASDPA
jgi:predicted amidohydrolase